MNDYRGFRAKTLPFLLGHPCWDGRPGIHREQCGYRVTWPSRTQGCLAPVAHSLAKRAPLRAPCLHSTVQRPDGICTIFSLAYPQTPPLKTILPFPNRNLLHSPFPPNQHLRPASPTRPLHVSILHPSRQFFASYTALPHNQTPWPRSAENSSSSVTVPAVKPAC